MPHLQSGNRNSEEPCQKFNNNNGSYNFEDKNRFAISVLGHTLVLGASELEETTGLQPPSECTTQPWWTKNSTVVDIAQAILS